MSRTGDWVIRWTDEQYFNPRAEEEREAEPTHTTQKEEEEYDQLTPARQEDLDHMPQEEEEG